MASARPPLTVLVLAAGLGKRMKSKRIKLLHPVAGRPMVCHVAEQARALRPARLVSVVGHQAEEVQEALEGVSDRFVLQKEQLGTGHAVLQAARVLRGPASATVLILNGDLPTLRPATLRAVISKHRRSGAAMTLVTTELDDPSGYGRIIRDDRWRVRRIVEDRDATEEEKAIREINCGIYCAQTGRLLPVLSRLKPDNMQGEYYLTDAIHELLARGEKVIAVRHEDAEEVLGVNSRAELARASKTLFARKAEALQDSGVTLLDADRTWIDPRARIGRDTVIYPDVIVEGATVIGEDCVVRPGCRIVDSVLGRRVEVRDHTVITESRVGNGTSIGPFAHLRPSTTLGDDVRVGNFVEVKKSNLGNGTKASHLSYLGDAEIGEETNVGAGTITCNYDGEKKHLTKLGRRVFIGSDTQLVAPVSVGDGAYVGAGATVTEDVPAGALAISRTPQKNIEGWVARREAKKKAKKKSRGSR